MDERKTLVYDWEFGHEELILIVEAYFDNNCLYIGLYQNDEGDIELFDDLTVNLANSPMEVK